MQVNNGIACRRVTATSGVTSTDIWFTHTFVRVFSVLKFSRLEVLDRQIEDR